MRFSQKLTAKITCLLGSHAVYFSRQVLRVLWELLPPCLSPILQLKLLHLHPIYHICYIPGDSNLHQ
jgi:hypothetical protein